MITYHPHFLLILRNRKTTAICKLHPDSEHYATNSINCTSNKELIVKTNNASELW